MIGNFIKTELQHAYCLCLPLPISATTRLGVYLPAPSSFSLAFDHGDGQLHITQYIPLQSQIYGMYACMYVCMYIHMYVCMYVCKHVRITVL